jgi:hypothetical protein
MEKMIDQLRYWVQSLQGLQSVSRQAHRRWSVSRAYTHRATLGVSETDSRPFSPLYIGKIVGLAGACM